MCVQVCARTRVCVCVRACACACVWFVWYGMVWCGVWCACVVWVCACVLVWCERVCVVWVCAFVVHVLHGWCVSLSVSLLNACARTHRLPRLWRQARVVALLKPGKDPSSSKSFRPISLLCHLYKLYERLILNRMSPIIEHVLIPEQAGFRPGKYCTAQVLNHIQHIEDGFETGKITGIVLVYLSAAYDTVNHRRLLEKVYNMTRDYRLMCMIRTLLENRRFFVELGGKRSRWRSQRNGLPQGSVLAPLLFKVYTNDQPIHPGTRSFVYVDDLAVTTQNTDFAPIEETLTSALDGLSEYYTTNQLRANPTKTQVSLFHPRNRECGKQLNISWNGVNVTHCNLPVYLGVTLDRTLSYKAHIEKTKKKVGTRNNIIRKLRTSKWGATPTTLRSSALALCYSAAEYACPVWERSTHAKKRYATLNETCRMITWCLKPTNTNSLPVLAGIVPPDIRRAVASRTERTRQATDERHPLNGHLGDASNRGKALWHALSPSTRLRKLPAWSYGENDSSPWTPECIWTSVLTNTSQLAQRIPGQPGRHSTGCVHRLAGQEWTCWSGDFPPNKKPVTVASGSMPWALLDMHIREQVVLHGHGHEIMLAYSRSL